MERPELILEPEWREAERRVARHRSEPLAPIATALIANACGFGLLRIFGDNYESAATVAAAFIFLTVIGFAYGISSQKRYDDAIIAECYQIIAERNDP